MKKIQNQKLEIQNQKHEIQKLGLSRLQRKGTSPPCISSDAISQTVFRSQGSEMLLCVGHLRVMALHPEWVWQPISSETSSYKRHLFVCPFVIYLIVGKRHFCLGFLELRSVRVHTKQPVSWHILSLYQAHVYSLRKQVRHISDLQELKYQEGSNHARTLGDTKYGDREKRNSKRYLCPSAHCSTLCISQDTEST